MANKQDLVNYVRETGVVSSKKQAGEVVDAVFGFITEKIAQDEDVTVTGFGKFSRVETAARKGRNPQTGEEIDIPASHKPHFKAFSGLKDAVR